MAQFFIHLYLTTNAVFELHYNYNNYSIKKNDWGSYCTINFLQLLKSEEYVFKKYNGYSRSY